MIKNCRPLPYPLQCIQMKNKQEGVSLLIVMGVSFFVLGMIMIILFAVSKSLERSANIARSNQVFFMTESGVEAAFYHHNARGAGLEFAQGSNDSLKIEHDAVGGKVEWGIHGRTTPVVGVLREGETVEIPLFWDSSGNPGEVMPDQVAGKASSFELKFYNALGDSQTEAGYADLKKKYGKFTFDTNFWGSDTEIQAEILIDWKVSRKNKDGKFQTFLPTEGGVDASADDRNKSAAIKVSELSGDVEIKSTDSKNGRVTPCVKSAVDAKLQYTEGATVGGCMTTLSAFVSIGNEFKLIFRPLLPFTNDDAKIPGIPYSVTAGTNNNDPIPKSTYDIIADVTMGNFTQQRKLTVPERTSIGAFNYVIFD